MLMSVLFFFLFAIPSIVVFIDFVKFFVTGKRFTKAILFRVFEFISIIGYPLFYLIGIDEHVNDCCSDSATFSPDHGLTIYTLIALCVIAYTFATFNKKIISPIIEILINSILVTGIVINVLLSIQIEQPLWLFGNLPIILLFTMQLMKNHNKFLDYSSQVEFRSDSKLYRLLWQFLHFKLIYKFPILLILCLPLLAILTGVLMLFGQQPDSAIRAFTDTYKHGFSQLDYLCENVECGGHFLCSVAAGGHRKIVKPQRLGERLGKPIICNRQLLISNAFEDLIEKKFPISHRIIRRNYNKVGDTVHRYYWIFENKYVADIIYFMMKPFEWSFLFALYVSDPNPENRIARQYLKPSERRRIETMQNNN